MDFLRIIPPSTQVHLQHHPLHQQAHNHRHHHRPLRPLLRHVIPLRLLLIGALAFGCCLLLLSWRVSETAATTGPDVLGLRASGLVQQQTAESHLPTRARQSHRGTGIGVWSSAAGSQGRPSSRALESFSEPLANWKEAAPFATPSLLWWRPRSTLLGQELSSRSSSRYDGKRKDRARILRAGGRIQVASFRVSCRRTRRWSGNSICSGSASSLGWTSPRSTFGLLCPRGHSFRIGSNCRRSVGPVYDCDIASWYDRRLGARHRSRSLGRRAAGCTLNRCQLGGWRSAQAICRSRARAGVGAHLLAPQSYDGSYARATGRCCVELGRRSWFRRAGWLLLSTGRRGRSSRDPDCTWSPKAQSKSSSWHYRRRREESKTYGCQPCTESGASFSGPPIAGGTDSGPHPQDGLYGRTSAQGPKVISIATASWRISFDWITQNTSCSPAQGGAPAKKYFDPFTTEGLSFYDKCRADGSRVGGGEDYPGAPGVLFDSCSFGAVKSSFCLGGPDCISRGSIRPQCFLDGLLIEGGRWETKATARTGVSQGDLLHCGHGFNGTPDAACKDSRSHPSRTDEQRSDCDSLCRALRWVRQVQRLWPGDVADSHDHGPSPDRKLWSGPGRCRIADGVSRTDSIGWGQDGYRPSPSPTRRPASRDLHQPHHGDLLAGKGLCSPSGPALDSKCPDLHQGAGYHQHQKSRCHQQTFKPTKRGRLTKPQESSKEACKTTSMAKEGSAAKRRGSLAGSNHEEKKIPAEDLLQTSISVPQVLASLPRWILGSRTCFASFLAQSFHIQRCGVLTPASVVYPLPIADFELFSGGGPKISRRRWLCLLRKRMRHIIIIALNFLHGGLNRSSLHLLGRKPNAVQSLVHRRLWALLTTCDSPGHELLSLVPGRSGPEFIARLKELEHFASAAPLLSTESYAGGPEDFEVKKIGAAPLREDSLQTPPYSALNSDRLKLVGRANWDIAEFLEDELWLPYQEPKILHHYEPIDRALGPNLAREDKEENKKLALKWSEQSLLALVHHPPHDDAFTRIFNAHKSIEHDRQIGDRRLANMTERHIQGPSKQLPIGYMMSGIYVPRGFILKGAVTDRKEFYHQAKASHERASTNVLPFKFKLSDFAGTEAHREFLERQSTSHRREDIGDKLGIISESSKQGRRGLLVRPPELEVYPAFKSLLQGDHLGVEFALSAHATLLERQGLLRPSQRIQGGMPFPTGRTFEGLIIDDYFVLSTEPNGAHQGPSTAAEHFFEADKAYRAEGVLGSPEKDIIDSCHFKVAGAEINSSQAATSKGIITVSAPVQKRISLAVLSLRVAQLPCISAALASRLAGNWTSVLLYRRCLTCILKELYTYGSQKDGKKEDVYCLSRRAAQELVLASVFSFVGCSDLRVGFHDRVVATDASLQKGAVVSRPVTLDYARALWLGGDKRGAYTALDPPFREASRILGLYEDDGRLDPDAGLPDAGHLPRALDFDFDFVEVCGGVAETSSFLASWGYVVMPPIELTNSKHFDLRDLKLVAWLMNMLKSRKLRSIMCEPVCTTFSPAAHPAVRTYQCPRGLDRKLPKVILGNIIAFRCFLLVWYASLQGAPSLLEQPRLSKMCWLSIWTFLLKHYNFEEAICASCQFGSIHRKEFRLLLWGIPAEELQVKCPGGHKHVPIAGKSTKPSATYVPELAKFFAKAFDRALRRRANREDITPDVSGIQSVLCNDALLTGSWSTDCEWFWRKPSHINVLESSAIVTLLRGLALEGGDLRATALVDSRVAKCSHAKGRSSALALGPTLKKAAAIQVAFGIYMSYGFAPTKLNLADDPTRDQPLRSTDAPSIGSLPVDRLAQLHSVGLSASSARWVRLALLLTLPTSCSGYTTKHFCDLGISSPSDLPSAYGFWTLALIFACWIFFGAQIWRQGGFSERGTSSRDTSPPHQPSRHHQRHHHSLLGILGTIICSLCSIPLCLSHFHGLQPLPLALVCFHCHGVSFEPSNTAERDRAQRRAEVQLQADRVLRPQTRNRRETLLTEFEAWLISSHRITLVSLVDGREVNPEEVANFLVEYGKTLFYGGKSYGRYSETINAVCARRPFLRKTLVSAWDLAFAWVSDEPVVHHPAMPQSILLAFCATAILWGWPTEAAILLLTWCGILRIGEVLNANRKDLVLPRDSAPGIDYTLLQIRCPKTRGSAARHQSARVDPCDVNKLLDAVFRNKPRHEKLWTMSPSTLRKRFGSLQKALGLPCEKSGDYRPYDLASLRPGGATYLLQKFEDSELVRRRGRWISSRVLEIYLQEVAVATFSQRLPDHVFDRVQRLAAAFPDLLEKAVYFLNTAVPANTWPRLW